MISMKNIFLFHEVLSETNEPEVYSIDDKRDLWQKEQMRPIERKKKLRRDGEPRN